MPDPKAMGISNCMGTRQFSGPAQFVFSNQIASLNTNTTRHIRCPDIQPGAEFTESRYVAIGAGASTAGLRTTHYTTVAKFHSHFQPPDWARPPSGLRGARGRA